MKTLLIYTIVQLITLHTSLLVIQVLANKDDYPTGSQDEEEVHVYKKYATYVPYMKILDLASPRVAYQGRDDDFDIEMGDSLSKLTSLPHRSSNARQRSSSSSRNYGSSNRDLEPEIEELLPISYMRRKKSSVSWLLAAAIRMCQRHPGSCLRQNEKEGLDMKNMVQNNG